MLCIKKSEEIFANTELYNMTKPLEDTIQVWYRDPKIKEIVKDWWNTCQTE